MTISQQMDNGCYMLRGSQPHSPVMLAAGLFGVLSRLQNGRRQTRPRHDSICSWRRDDRSLDPCRALLIMSADGMRAGRSAVRDAAQAGARHLQRTAPGKSASVLVYCRERSLEELYCLGYCRGPAGTARVFRRLYKVTPETSYLQWAERFAQGVAATV